MIKSTLPEQTKSDDKQSNDQLTDVCCSLRVLVLTWACIL